MASRDETSTFLRLSAKRQEAILVGLPNIDAGASNGLAGRITDPQQQAGFGNPSSKSAEAGIPASALPFEFMC
jgi:hypothetical protein